MLGCRGACLPACCWRRVCFVGKGQQIKVMMVWRMCHGVGLSQKERGRDAVCPVGIFRRNASYRVGNLSRSPLVAGRACKRAFGVWQEVFSDGRQLQTASCQPRPFDAYLYGYILTPLIRLETYATTQLLPVPDNLSMQGSQRSREVTTQPGLDRHWKHFMHHSLPWLKRRRRRTAALAGR